MSNQWPLQKDCLEFYGDPRPRHAHESYNVAWAHENLVSVRCPWALNMGAGHPVPAITVHKKVAESLSRVLAKVAGEMDAVAIRAARYDVFSGSFVVRPMRGGASMSMHAFGAAIDWDAPDNQMHAQRHLFTDESPLIKAFKAEGWIWGGDWSGSGVDAMHVQAARVHS